MANSPVMGNIVERKFNEKYKFDSNRVSTVEHELGFPKVFKLDDNVLTKKDINRKQSLFRQHVSTLKPTKGIAKIQKDEFLHSNKEEVSFVAEDQLADKIHQENLDKLAKMSEVDILKEKKILEETLDSKIIQFLKNRKKCEKRSIEKSMNTASSTNSVVSLDTESSDKKLKLSLNDNNNTEIENDTNISITKEITMDVEVPDDKKTKFPLKGNDTNMDWEDDTVSIPKSSKEILEASKQKGWLHMNKPEPEKLKWMKDLTEEKEELATNEEYNARFDFNGLLLPYKDENVTLDKGLHHHGEEPERPGYSLQELLQLSRSSIQQQRCKALTTLANVMEKTHEGRYDKALHPSPLIALSQKNILLLLRFSLDDSSVAVVTASLQALRAFLVSEADEICLDRLHGFNGHVEPTLIPQLEDKDTGSLKDHELAQLDAVTTLLRSDFLLRVRYILNEMHPPPIGVTCALEILIRLARYSHTTALNISSTPYLLDTIIQNFMPLSIDLLAMQDAINNIYGIPVVKAIKLCRVLVTYGKKPVAQKLNNFKVIHTILTYVNSETGKDDLELSIESLRLWRMLLHYEIGLESVTGALISQLQLLLSNHDIQSTSKNELACERAAALIAVASHERNLRLNMSTLLKKWNTQFLSVSNATWGVMKLIAEILATVETSSFEIPWLSNEHIFLRLRSSSNLLSDCNPATDRTPSCLPNLDVYTENGEPQPIVSINSCIPFFASVLKTFCKHSRLTEIRTILEHPNFCKYIRDLEKFNWSFERSWYSRTELCFLTMVVKAASLLGNTINNQTAQIIWKIAIKLVSALPADATDDVRELLKIALSNEKVNLELIVNELAKLDLVASTTTNQVKIDLRSDAASLYEKYVVPNGDWNQAAMPKDWLFLPLVHLYNKYKSDVKFQSEDKGSILTVLSLALILPDLTRRLSPTLRFSRLILVYLCDTVYLDKDVSALLAKVLSNLLTKHHARLDFQAELPGLSSFTDLFTALCEQFYSSSYGDNNFAATLLVPVAQRHDAHYRKLLWSEHAAALRYLKLSPEKLLLPLKDYLYPEEEDASLIDSYITALVRGTIKETWCPVPFIIALHHSAMYLKRTNKLAVRMRTQMEKLRNRDIADKLLHYESP
ncbi:RNA polymerase II-associated protein 1 [Camponotus floridanus]|uniref:RNA polymerase II-associated protein 1 n=1 Tax=Camponotus floridanus TaxID=104421 RepID=UPI000DC6B81E|nr:RNA polymerase II-associated protein 1 [Camponotus floridanus]